MSTNQTANEGPFIDDICDGCGQVYVNHLLPMAYCPNTQRGTVGWTNKTFKPVTPEPVPSLPKEQGDGTLYLEVENNDSTNIITDKMTPRQKAFAEVKDMTLSELTELYLEYDRLRKENEQLKNQNAVHCKREQEHLIEVGNLHSVMVAAAEEIQEHWQAHCDQEGYGPANLMHRLESGIAANYQGYKFGAFTKLQKDNEELKAALKEANGFMSYPSGRYAGAGEDQIRFAELRNKIAKLLNP